MTETWIEIEDIILMDKEGNTMPITAKMSLATGEMKLYNQKWLDSTTSPSPEESKQ